MRHIDIESSLFQPGIIGDLKGNINSERSQGSEDAVLLQYLAD